MLTLLITLDCVRADYLDGSRGLTPNLDALAPEWTTFTEAFAQSQNTLSSHLSMLTSNYLFQHGVYSNFAKKDLPAHSLPKRLAERGWECRAFTSVDFLATLLGNQVGETDPRFPPAEDRSLRARWTRRRQGRRATAEETLRTGLKWLKKRSTGDNLFLWLHLFDAHMVYEAPNSFLRDHLSGESTDVPCLERIREKGWFSPDFPEYGWKVPLEHFPQRYAAAVAYQDRCLGRFFGDLKATGLWDDSLVVVTADHGEGLLGDHAVYCAHKKLFDTTVKVPLRVHFPSGKFAGERIDSIVQHVDIAPTAAAAAGLEETLFMGRNLLDIASGKDPGHAFTFAEHVDNFLRAARNRDRVYVERVPGSENKWGLRMEEGDLFTRGSAPVADEDPAARESLKGALEELLNSRPDVAEAWGQASGAEDAVADRLRELGYM